MLVKPEDRPRRARANCPSRGLSTCPGAGRTQLLTAGGTSPSAAAPCPSSAVRDLSGAAAPRPVLLCPVTPTAATRSVLAARTITVNGRERSVFEQSVWPGLAGAAHLPAAVVPVGRTREGLPVGMQVVAPHLEDRTAVDVARRIAHVVGGYERPPA